MVGIRTHRTTKRIFPMATEKSITIPSVAAVTKEKLITNLVNDRDPSEDQLLRKLKNYMLIAINYPASICDDT